MNTNIDKSINPVTQAGSFLTRVLRADGSVKQDWKREHNTGMDQGLAYLNSAGFQRGPAAVTPKATWYIGIYEGTVDTSTLKATTAATVAAATTEVLDTNYAETGRILWSPNDATGNNNTDRVVTNLASPASFTMTATKNVTGAFLVSEQASGGTSGTEILFAISNFDAVRNTQSDDVLQVVYDSTISS